VSVLLKKMSARRAPTAAEVAEYTSPTVQETETDKLKRKSRDQPFVPLGKHKTISQYLLYNFDIFRCWFVTSRHYICYYEHSI
jgi:hypothetical protein